MLLCPYIRSYYQDGKVRMMEEEKKENKKDLWAYAKRLLIIIAVVALGVFAVNQVIEYRYNAYFLQAPCNVCKELNPNMSRCIDGCFTFKRTLFADGSGNWKDDMGNCYSSGGDVITCYNTSVSTFDLSNLNLSKFFNLN